MNEVFHLEKFQKYIRELLPGHTDYLAKNTIVEYMDDGAEREIYLWEVLTCKDFPNCYHIGAAVNLPIKDFSKEHVDGMLTALFLQYGDKIVEIEKYTAGGISRVTIANYPQVWADENLYRQRRFGMYSVMYVGGEK